MIVNGIKNRGLKHRVTFSNAIEKNYMIHLKVIQKKLKYQYRKKVRYIYLTFIS